MRKARCSDRIVLGAGALTAAILTWSCSSPESLAPEGLGGAIAEAPTTTVATTSASDATTTQPTTTAGTTTTQPNTTTATASVTSTTGTTAASTLVQVPKVSQPMALPMVEAVLATWLINSTGEVAPVIRDDAGIPVNVQSAELIKVDGVLHVRVEATGIPNYAHDINGADEVFLSGRPKADTDFRTGRPLVGVGSRVRFGDDIGYRSTGCDSEPGTGFGFWPPGPTCPARQTWEASFPVRVVEAIDPEAQSLAAIGLWVNGVAVFGWSDGHSWLEQGTWHNLAPEAEVYDLDICPGHSAFGTYHHHSHPVCLAEQLVDVGTDHSPVYGFALDGAPIAGPWAGAGLLARSSWTTRDYNSPNSSTGCGAAGLRTCLLVDQLDPTAGIVTTDRSGPSTNGNAQSLSGNAFITSSGFYMEDWYYEPSFNDGSEAALDEHNGHTGRLPGFSEPAYHYHVTRKVADDGSIVDTFPYYIGPTFYGVPSAAGLGPSSGGPGAGGPGAGGPGAGGPGAGGPGAGGPGAGGPPDLTVAAATLGVSVAELAQALGPPPPNLAAAAESLGIPMADLQEALSPT